MKNPLTKSLPTLCFLLAFSLLFSTTTRADNRNLIVQTTPSDCGPAALATLLHYYLRIPANEKEMEKLSGATMAFGTTLLGLEKAAVAKGCAADSFRMDYATLQQQLGAFAPPVIVSLSIPQPHFAVVLQAGDEYVFMADPALGNVFVRKKEFLLRWLEPASVMGLPAAGGATTDTKTAPTGFVFLAVGEDGEEGRQLRQETVGRLLRQLENLLTARPRAAPFRR